MTQQELSGEVYYANKNIIEGSHGKNWEDICRFAEEDLEGFWAKEASELHWFKKWDKVLDDSAKPFFKWFTGGSTNIAYNCLDRHTKTYRRNKLALIWEGEGGEFRSYSYFALKRDTCRFANVLKSLGV
jgi:acetyl-CoA synthetase